MQGTAHFIIPHHRCQFDMPMESGQSILDLAKSSVGVEMLGEYIEGACGGMYDYAFSKE